MRIAIFQGPAASGDPDSNLQLLARTAEEAAAAGVRLLVCSEMFLSGYNIGVAAARERAQAVDGPAAARAAQIARDCSIGLVFGYPERGANGAIYNAALCLDAQGRTLANYRKTHLYGDLDRAMFTPGHDPVVTADFEGTKIGLLICYDVEFPEAVRLLALAGVDLVIVPTAQMEAFAAVAERIIGARAFESQIFIAYANRCGSEAELAYCGLSVIAGPDGRDLARARADEGLLIADIDIAALRRSRLANPYLSDRRPELYGPLARYP